MWQERGAIDHTPTPPLDVLIVDKTHNGWAL